MSKKHIGNGISVIPKNCLKIEFVLKYPLILIFDDLIQNYNRCQYFEVAKYRYIEKSHSSNYAFYVHLDTQRIANEKNFSLKSCTV